ncbi:MAG: 2-dehydropantoate 2-reductase [Clostridia bacterium]|nr:2-dehydropantoate 2-reductase [Clostridia bacterium]
MRVVIYGAGAMGTILGAYINRQGKNVDLVTRNKAHADAINKRGAHVTGTVDFTVPARALAPEDIEGVYDIIFLMTKQGDNGQILTFLLPHLAPDGIVCTMQNGLPEPSVAEVVGENRCCGCAVSWGATFVGEGASRLTTSPSALQFALGNPYGKADAANFTELKDLLSCMGKVTVESNFIGARWIKLSINCAFSALSAMSSLTFGEVANSSFSKKVALEIFNESIAAGCASGIKPEKIQGHDVAKLLAYKNKLKKRIALLFLPIVMKNHSALQSGMLFDLQKGKRCEAEFINGVVCAYGERAGFATPFNSLALKIIGEIKRGERKITPENINLFKNLL